MATVITVITVILSLLGAVSAAFSLLPRVTVSAETSSIESGKGVMNFVINNTTPIPLYNVRIMMGVCEIGFGYSIYHNNCSGPLKLKFIPKSWHSETLLMDDKKTVSFEDVFIGSDGSDPEYADISVIVTYEPLSVSTFERAAEFKFLLRRMSDGKRYWFARPNSE